MSPLQKPVRERNGVRYRFLFTKEAGSARVRVLCVPVRHFLARSRELAAGRGRQETEARSEELEANPGTRAVLRPLAVPPTLPRFVDRRILPTS